MVRDKSQEKVVYANEKISMVVMSPPGYGKTYTMARRIEYLVKNGKLSGNRKILGITFSNAAANEMHKNLDIQDPNLKKRVKIINYHAFCYKILKTFSDKIGLSRDFEIISTLEKKRRMKEAFQHYDVDVKEGLSYLTKIDNSILNGEEFLERLVISSFLRQKLERAYNYYVQSLLNEGKIDFNLIIEKTLELWDNYPEYLDLYRKKYQYLIIDEFQDTNILQYKIIKRLVKGSLDEEGDKKDYIPFQCYCDPHQSIYVFQGALARRYDVIIDDFNPQLMILDKNYRTSSKLIQAICLQLRDGEEISNDDDDEKVNCYIFNNQKEESEFIIEKINEIIEKGVPLEEICIISSTYERLNVIKSQMESREINFIYLKDFRSELIEEKFQNIFLKFDEMISRRDNAIGILEVFSNVCENNNYNRDDIVIKAISNFILRRLKNHKFKRLKEWQKALDIKNDIHLELNWGMIVRENIKDKIFLSSIHQVKGLEFQHVFFIGLENNVFPTYWKCKRCKNGTEIVLTEEESVFYVGVSRTISELIFTSSNEVIKWGNKWTVKLNCLIENIGNHVRFIDYKTQDSLRIENLKC